MSSKRPQSQDLPSSDWGKVEWYSCHNRLSHWRQNMHLPVLPRKRAQYSDMPPKNYKSLDD